MTCAQSSIHVGVTSFTCTPTEFSNFLFLLSWVLVACSPAPTPAGYLRPRCHLRPSAGFPGVHPPRLEPQPLRQAGAAPAGAADEGDAQRVRLPKGADPGLPRGGYPLQVTIDGQTFRFGKSCVHTQPRSFSDAVYALGQIPGPVTTRDLA